LLVSSETEEAARENMQDAIREYLAAVDDLGKDENFREVRVAISPCPKSPGVNHLDAVRALSETAFSILRQVSTSSCLTAFLILTSPRPIIRFNALQLVVLRAMPA